MVALFGLVPVAATAVVAAPHPYLNVVTSEAVDSIRNVPGLPGPGGRLTGTTVTGGLVVSTVN